MKKGFDVIAERVLAREIANNYNLNEMCAARIYTCLLTNTTANEIKDILNYLTTLLTSMGKNPHEINKLVLIALKNEKFTTPKKLNDSIKMCIYYDSEIGEILNTCDIVKGDLDAETIYSLAEVTKEENIEYSLKTIKSLNSKLDEEARTNLKKTYPITSKVKFISHFKFENYKKALNNNNTNKNVLCK